MTGADPISPDLARPEKAHPKPGSTGPLRRTARPRLIALAILGCVAGYGALDQWQRRHLFLINVTQSLPNWAFVVTRDGAPTRGSLVFFVAPDTALVRRHFGNRPPAFGKYVVGLPGERVTRDGNLFRVNGQVVAKAKRTSLRGERLEPGPTGVLPRGCFFVATPHPDGFDSRYAAIGWICRDRILGIGEAIL